MLHSPTVQLVVVFHGSHETSPSIAMLILVGLAEVCEHLVTVVWPRGAIEACVPDDGQREFLYEIRIVSSVTEA